ncbi:MAG: MFS transporter [Chloroflexi bacterium]|nr:MFS transporter [Chloroflexota bacterium]
MQRDNLRVLAGMSFLRGAHTSIYNTLWQPFAASLGASASQIGLISAIAGTNGLLATLVQPIGGRLADRFGRKPVLIAAGLGTLAAYAAFESAGIVRLFALIVCGALFLSIAAISRPASSSMTAESARTERHASAFSLMMAVTMAPGIVAPALGGALADHAGYIAIFPVMLALEAIAMVLLWRCLVETNARQSARVSPRSFWRLIVPPRRLIAFYGAIAGDSFAWGMGFGILSVMLVKTLHFTNEQLGIQASVMSLAWALMQYPIGRFVDQRGTKATMVFSESLGLPLMLIWMAQPSFEIFVASQILFALTAATWVPVTNTYLTRSVAPAERAEAFGRANLFRGLIAFPAPWIGGMLYEWGGMTAPLAANLIGSVSVMLLMIVFLREPHVEEME